jgi:hypothetical protein
MKRTLILFLAMLAGAIAFSIAFFYYATHLQLGSTYYIVYSVIMAISLVGVAGSFRRLMDERKGIPADDELTLKLGRKAAFDSFPYSLSLWITILVCSMGSKTSVLPISFGIIGMSLIYGGFWLYYKSKGILND